MKVFRVHHKESLYEGPWRGKYSGYFSPIRKALSNMITSHCNEYGDTVHNPPESDGIGCLLSDMLIGCESFEQLCFWFADVDVDLYLEGFVFSELEVPEEFVKRGRTQLAFNPLAAKVLRTQVFDPMKEGV